jgi:uncharacterized protein YciW
MTPLRSIPLLGVALVLAACGPRRATWDEVRPPEAHLDTLPTGALLLVDGVEVGRTPLSIPVRDVTHTYALRLEAAGFETLESRQVGESMAGARLQLVLRPLGFGTQRKLDPGDPVGLAQAAAALLKAGLPREALAFASASVEAGDSAVAHRLSGEAYRQLGNRNRAVQEYSLYLSMDPGAPDRAAIEKAIAAARGDIPMTAPRTE